MAKSIYIAPTITRFLHPGLFVPIYSVWPTSLDREGRKVQRDMQASWKGYLIGTFFVLAIMIPELVQGETRRHIWGKMPNNESKFCDPELSRLKLTEIGSLTKQIETSRSGINYRYIILANYATTTGLLSGCEELWCFWFRSSHAIMPGAVVRERNATAYSPPQSLGPASPVILPVSGNPISACRRVCISVGAWLKSRKLHIGLSLKQKSTLRDISLESSINQSSASSNKSEYSRYSYTNVEGKRITPDQLFLCAVLFLGGMIVMAMGITRGLRFGWIMAPLGGLLGLLLGLWLLPA